MVQRNTCKVTMLLGASSDLRSSVIGLRPSGTNLCYGFDNCVLPLSEIEIYFEISAKSKFCCCSSVCLHYWYMPTTCLNQLNVLLFDCSMQEVLFLYACAMGKSRSDSIGLIS